MWYVLGMYLVCNVFGRYLACRWPVSGMYLVCIWYVLGMSLACIWLVFDIHLACIGMRMIWYPYDMIP